VNQRQLIEQMVSGAGAIGHRIVNAAAFYTVPTRAGSPLLPVSSAPALLPLAARARLRSKALSPLPVYPILLGRPDACSDRPAGVENPW